MMENIEEEWADDSAHSYKVGMHVAGINKSMIWNLYVLLPLPITSTSEIPCACDTNN